MTSDSSLPDRGADRAADAGVHPSHALAIYLERLVRSRRVVVLGDATLGLAELLVERGARLVHSYDPDPSRASSALARTSRVGRAPQVSHGALVGDLGVRDGAFDLVLVPDLGAFDDPANIVALARRLVGPGGAVAVASRNPDTGPGLLAGESSGEAPSYYALYDLVSLQFPVVRMLGQAPFVGYAVVDFAPDGEPDVSVDTSLLEATEEPELFIAIGSERPVVLDAYTVVEIPFEALGAAGVEPLGDETRSAALGAQVARLTAELAALRADRDAAEGAARDRAGAAVIGAARAAELEGELARAASRLKEMEARVGDAHVRAERLVHKARDLEDELARQRERGTRLARQLDDEKRARTRAELELGMARGAPESDESERTTRAELDATRARLAGLEAELEAARRELSGARAEAEAQRRRAVAANGELESERARARELAEDPESAAELDRLEKALLERGRALAAAERELRESERIGRELIDELEALRAAGGALDALPSGGDPGFTHVPGATTTHGASVDDALAAAQPETEGGGRAEGRFSLRDRLDGLAQACARLEADRRASAWRIAMLERELAELTERSGEAAASSRTSEERAG